MFMQTLGRCVMLPPYAIDVDARRSGVRVVVDAVVQPGGPRYLYTDPLMLETSVRWIDAMLGEFAGHPAIAMWDIGHDPAGGVRPLRIDDLRAWVALISGRIHEREQRCMLSLSANDLVTARARAPGDCRRASSMRLGSTLPVRHSRRLVESRIRAAAAFLLQLAQSLGGDVPLFVHLGAHRQCTNARTVTTATTHATTDAASRRFADASVDALVDLGAAGVLAAHVEQPGTACRDDAALRQK